MTKKTGKDLLEASFNADYKAIQECLADGVPVDYVDEANENCITKVIWHAGNKKGSETQSMECIRLLYQHGANLNYVMGGYQGYCLFTVLDILDDKVYVKNPMDLYNAVKFILTHGGKNKTKRLRDLGIERLEVAAKMPKADYEKFEKIGDEYLKHKEEYDWLENHPHPTVADYLAPLGDEGRNVITSLVHAGSDVLDQAFPVEKWATMEAIPKLKKIFAGVPRRPTFMETMQKLDSKLRTTYNLNKRRQERQEQHQPTLTKPIPQKNDGR